MAGSQSLRISTCTLLGSCRLYSEAHSKPAASAITLLNSVTSKATHDVKAALKKPSYRQTSSLSDKTQRAHAELVGSDSMNDPPVKIVLPLTLDVCDVVRPRASFVWECRSKLARSRRSRR
eukprot:1152731-Pyramimonas_sp.AAC.1